MKIQYPQHDAYLVICNDSYHIMKIIEEVGFGEYMVDLTVAGRNGEVTASSYFTVYNYHDTFDVYEIPEGGEDEYDVVTSIAVLRPFTQDEIAAGLSLEMLARLPKLPGAEAVRTAAIGGDPKSSPMYRLMQLVIDRDMQADTAALGMVRIGRYAGLTKFLEGRDNHDPEEIRKAQHKVLDAWGFGD